MLSVIFVTAKGQYFYQGIILDNWRYGGRLVWGYVLQEPFYQWHENKSQFLKVVAKRAVPVSFFFQAEDGIRDLTVTGVQTCALPIYFSSPPIRESDYFGCWVISWDS